MKTIITLKDLSKKYVMGDTTVVALDHVSLTIEQGDFVAIMGPSGSGKSTLMHILGLLDLADEGSYNILGQEVSHLNEDALAVLRRRMIGFVFQQFNLLPRMSAEENVCLPQLYSRGSFDGERGKELLSQVGLGERTGHHPNEMSGGQQQRVAIARALVNQPLMILADEPTGNLDSASEKEIMALLKSLNEQGITVVIVTHEEEIGAQAKRVIRMRDGRVQSDERREALAPTEREIRSEDFFSEAKEKEKSHLGQHFLQAVKNLTVNKVRTALSMLGILIGVGAVVAMIAVGRGAQNAIAEQLSSLGSNLLVLRSGAHRGPGGSMGETGATTRLTVEDATAIARQVPGVKEAAPYVSSRGQVTYKSKNWNTSVLGVSPSYEQMHNYTPQAGRFFSNTEVSARSRVALIGVRIQKEIFGDEDPLGKEIKINKVNFLVIGILPEKGASGPFDQDDRIIIPVTTAMKRLFGKLYLDSIEIGAVSSDATSQVQEQTEKLMLMRHRVPEAQKEEAFSIRNMAEIQEALTSSTATMTLLLSVIAAISLVVGGIGIMNIMLVSVTERTREIGLRKAVGARRPDILLQFLVEAVVISAVGGILGILLAWVATLVLTYVAGWATSITLSSILLAVLFSTSVGVVFGLYPARKASLLAPIQALRYE